ncbi:hypothetical protein MesoLj131c_70390 (plasmid) [Mesorhizobium sp. 131-3-5]|nr:hypothetical protein MesoLj131c_70390 [Mesorhizobium sp. 131-3-5]
MRLGESVVIPCRSWSACSKEMAPPVGEMAVAAIAGRMVLDDVAGEHDVGVGHEGDDVACRMRATKEFKVHPPFAHIER